MERYFALKIRFLIFRRPKNSLLKVSYKPVSYKKMRVVRVMMHAKVTLDFDAKCHLTKRSPQTFQPERREKREISQLGAWGML